MTDDIHFAKFRHATNAVAKEIAAHDIRKILLRNIERRQVEASPAGGSFLEDQPFIQLKVSAGSLETVRSCESFHESVDMSFALPPPSHKAAPHC